MDKFNLILIIVVKVYNFIKRRNNDFSQTRTWKKKVNILIVEF